MPKHIIYSRSPESVWAQSEDGWYSRPWKPRERAEYCRSVLNREPYAGES
jgi:hypothetical protein